MDASHRHTFICVYIYIKSQPKYSSNSSQSRIVCSHEKVCPWKYFMTCQSVMLMIDLRIKLIYKMICNIQTMHRSEGIMSKGRSNYSYFIFYSFSELESFDCRWQNQSPMCLNNNQKMGMHGIYWFL